MMGYHLLFSYFQIIFINSNSFYDHIQNHSYIAHYSQDYKFLFSNLVINQNVFRYHAFKNLFVKIIIILQ